MNKIFIFTLGTICGSVVTWFIVKNKYKQIAQEEIDSVKEVYLRGHRKDVGVYDDAIEIAPDTEDVGDDDDDDDHRYDEILAKLGYDTQIIEGGNADVEPYVISPEEFGCKSDYDAITLNYYTDGIVADDWDEIVEDIAGVIGTESLDTYGEYEEDTVYVRNERLKADYEILKNDCAYAEAVARHTRSEQYDYD